MPHQFITVTDTTFDEIVCTKTGVALVYFWTAWSGSCYIMTLVIKRLMEEENLNVYRLDMEQNKDIPNRYQITKAPTITIFNDDELVDFVSGICSYRELAQRIDTLRVSGNRS